MYWLRPVMVPFVVAVFISLALEGVAGGLTRATRLPRWLAIATTLAVAALAFAGAVALVSTSVSELSTHAVSYQQRISELFESATAALPAAVRARVGSDTLQDLTRIPVAAIGNTLVRTTNAILGILSNSFLVLIFVVFLMLGRRGGVSRSDDTWGEIELRIERYIVQKALISAATGLLVGLVLAVIGIELAMVFGLMAFLLNFIPSIGSVIATLLPVPVVLLSPEVSTFAAVLAIGIPAIIQVSIGNVLEPKIMGDSLDLHPVMILMALIFWGMLWGILGMLLATPITAVLKILFEKLEPTRPVARLMAGDLAGLRGAA